jgi:methylphosphotriester-DNA--protein-cysteine methyltransferase
LLQIDRAERGGLASVAAPLDPCPRAYREPRARADRGRRPGHREEAARLTGTSPIKWLIARRVQASLPLLERTDLGVEQIAAAVGFETPVTFRHHSSRAMRTSPSAYRRAFRPREASLFPAADTG